MTCKIQHIALLALAALSVTACSNSHDTGSTDAGTLPDAATDMSSITDMHVPNDAEPLLDACAAFSCYRVCEIGEGNYCDSDNVVSSECSGTCPEGYAYECDSFAPACMFLGDGGVTDAAPIDLTACEYNADCVVVPASCCGVCGTASPTDMTAVNSTHVSDHYADVCSGGVGCPACAGEPDRNLVAECVSNHCVARNLRTTPIQACESDVDCAIRVASCCECGSESTGPYIAVNVAQEGAYEALVCDPRAGACAEDGCDEYPSQPFPTCIGDPSSGIAHCELVFGED